MYQMLFEIVGGPYIMAAEALPFLRFIFSKATVHPRGKSRLVVLDVQNDRQNGEGAVF